MPKVTVYIRNEDYDKWKAVEQKAMFIHNALNPKTRLVNAYTIDNETGKTVSIPFVSDISSKPPLVAKACKHGYDPQFCKFAKPGKRCK